MGGYGQPVVQSTHLSNQSPFMNHINLQNATNEAEQLPTSKTNPFVIELLNQQQAL